MPIEAALEGEGEEEQAPLEEEEVSVPEPVQEEGASTEAVLVAREGLPVACPKDAACPFLAPSGAGISLAEEIKATEEGEEEVMVVHNIDTLLDQDQDQDGDEEEEAPQAVPATVGSYLAALRQSITAASEPVVKALYVAGVRIYSSMQLVAGVVVAAACRAGEAVRAAGVGLLGFVRGVGARVAAAMA